VQEVRLHDGPVIQLRKLDASHDPTDRLGALRLLEEARAKQEFITGLIYLDESRPTLPDLLELPETPLVHLSDQALRPPKEALDKLIASLA
jgi:2-oxoglutarate ferredoxin oxidoreductase subunit beta